MSDPIDVTCSLFRGVRRRVVRAYNDSWLSFVSERLPDLLARTGPEPVDDTKDAWEACKTRLPGFVLAPVGGTRSDANTGAHTALVIDVDALPEGGRKALFRACKRYACVAHESPSSGATIDGVAKGTRLRVIAALTEPVAPELVKAARRAFARDLGLDPGASGVTKADSVSQVMFAGRVGGTPERRMWVFAGRVWVPPADLKPEASPVRPFACTVGDDAPTPAFGPGDVPKIAPKLRSAIEPKAGRQRHGGRDLMRGVGGMYARKGWHPEAIATMVAGLPSAQPEKRATEAREAAEQWYAGDLRTAGVNEIVRHFRDVLGGDDGERVGRRVVSSIDKAARRPGEPEGWVGPFDDAAAKWWPVVEAYWAERGKAQRAANARAASAAARTGRSAAAVEARKAEAQEKLAAVAPDLVGMLETGDDGKPYSHASNVGLCVRHYVGHAVARNAATGRPVVTDRVVLATGAADEVLEPGLWEDVHTTRLHGAVCRLGLARPSRSDVDSYVRAVAAERAFWPIRDYLSALSPWDGTDRSLCTYLGVECTDYAVWVCGAWLRSCVARGFVPGCQVDHVLVLEGEQGASKSTALRVLASDEWFGEFTAKPGDPQKVGEQLQGKWIVEIGELDKWTRTYTSAELKSMLTRRDDDYRTPYDRYPAKHPRTSVYSASTNHEEYLTDDTGNRRYWPIVTGATGDFDIAGLARDREQILAQALFEYRQHCDAYTPGGAPTGLEWWPATQEIKAALRSEQAKRMVSDAWSRTVAKWVRDQERPFTSEQVARHAIGLELERVDTKAIARVERCLLACACVRTETKRGRAWRRAAE